MNNKVVYTAITGDYDNLKTPEYVNPDWDYICFTDRPDLRSDVWQIVKVPKLPNEKIKLKAREIKILFYKYVSLYDMSLWADGSVMIKGDITKFVMQNTKYFGNADFVTLKHPVRINIIEEAEACTERHKAEPEDIKRQMMNYYERGYNFDNGLISSGLIFRNHTEQVQEFCKHWFREIEKFTIRDQLSFNFVLSQFPIEVGLLPFSVLEDGTYFKLLPHLP